ncbi:Ras family GTPase [Catovirus CTV1]|uniref:Ras family GTPase n=1 Tax=Catovirus CTV1 TaxID=1977631 RepID=A0A1V0SBU0_9VIRU|nr:Ras family GTPase [Catovirus CTV1]
MNELLFKYAFIGDSGVGKTTLLYRLKYGEYKNAGPTIGIDHYFLQLTANNRPVKIHIWDTAGQERFRSITNHFYKNTNVLFIIFDLTNIESFNNVDYWLNDAMNHNTNNALIVLIGTKSDLESLVSVSKEVIEKCVSKNGIMYYETNAMTDHIQYIITDVTSSVVKSSEVDNTSTSNNIILQEDKHKNLKKYCCN